MKLRGIHETPFLKGLEIEAEDPWVIGQRGRKLKSKSELVALELCAGAGGQAIGLEQSGIGHVGLLEIDPHACSTLRLNRPKWNVIQEDLNNFDATPFAGADVVAAGLPCPPFSVAGKQLGRLDERNLFPSMIRVVDQVRPRAVMVEASASERRRSASTKVGIPGDSRPVRFQAQIRMKVFAGAFAQCFEDRTSA